MKLIEELRARLATLITERKATLDAIAPADFTEEREAEIKAKSDEIDALRARIDSLVEQEARVSAAGAAMPPAGVITNEANPVYRKDDFTNSFFRDLFNSRARGDRAATERLVRSQEKRDVGGLTTTAGDGGEFAPPAWLIGDFVELARAGRVTADLVQHDTLPEGVSSINLPRVATGTTVAAQTTQNSSVSNTELTTDSVSSGIITIAGQQVASLQLLQQSGIPFDRVIVGDLARAYAAVLDGEVINGTGAGHLTGILNTSSINAQTYTSAAPKVVSATGADSFYSQLVQAVSAVAQNRLLQPTVIVMHPRRWAWVLNALDSQSRPLVVPNGPAVNALAVSGGVAAQGAAGTLLGLPVYVDPNIPTTLSSTQDAVIVMRADDLWLYESALSTASFDATYANQLSVLFRVHAFAAFIPNRYPKSIAVIKGTGTTTPTF